MTAAAPPDPKPGDPLTRREVEVLARFAAGHDRTETARALALSPSTVQTHLRRASLKLGVRSIPAAVARLCWAGHLEPPPGKPMVRVVAGYGRSTRRAEPVEPPMRVLPAVAADLLEACARAVLSCRVDAADQFAQEALDLLDTAADEGRAA